MELPSQIKFTQQIRHFANIYFEAENINDILDHGQSSTMFCNTCKMFYEVIQSIYEDILGTPETLDGWTTVGGGGVNSINYIYEEI